MNVKPARHRGRASLLAAAAMGCHLAAAAAVELDAEGIPTVEVVDNMPLPGLGQSRYEIPAAVQSANAAAIERSLAIDLSAFVNRNMAGVHLNDIQGNPWQPDVSYRGYTASPLLGTAQGLSIYFDGVRLNQPFGDVVSWDLIPRAAIASVTLMPGSNPLFGLNTLGGALSIRSKDGRSDPGSAIGVQAGSNRRRLVEAEHGGSNAQGLHWYVTGNVFSEDGWRDASPSDVRQLFGKLGWADARSDLTLALALADNRLTGNGMQEQRLLARNYASVYSKPDQTDNTSVLLNLGGKHQLGEALSFTGNIHYRRIRSTTLNGDVNEDSLDQSLYQPSAAERAALAAAGYSGFPVSGATASNTAFPSWRCIGNVLLRDEPAEKCNGLINRSGTTQESAGFAGQLTLQSGDARLRQQSSFGVAYDASRSRFTQASQLGYLNPDRSITGLDAYGDGISGGNVDGVPYDTRVDLDGRSRSWSVFATHALSIDARWHLTLAGRFNRSTVVNRDHIVPGGGPGSLDGDHVFQRFNPAIGLSFTPDTAINAYAGYNEGSRTPTSVELGCADSANPCKLPNAMAGDPPLRQVVTKSWEAGLRGKLAATLHWNAALFRADNIDDILFVADNAAGFGYFRNFGRTRRQGIELTLDGKLARLDTGLGYTYVDATYRSRETVNGSANSSNDAASGGLPGNIAIVPGNRIPLVPRHLFKAHADLGISAAWSVGVALDAVSSAYARGNENNLHQADGGRFLGAGASGGYAVVELNTHYRVTPRLSVYAQVGNLFDRQYANAAQLGATAFDANGRFVARPYAPVAGAYPLQQSGFFAPGAPRAIRVGLRYAFDATGVQ